MKFDSDFLTVLVSFLFKYGLWAWLSATLPNGQKDASSELVTGSLFIHNILPLIRALKCEIDPELKAN